MALETKFSPNRGRGFQGRVQDLGNTTLHQKSPTQIQIFTRQNEAFF
jgi:hypothetical protein